MRTIKIDEQILKMILMKKKNVTDDKVNNRKGGETKQGIQKKIRQNGKGWGNTLKHVLGKRETDEERKLNC